MQLCEIDLKLKYKNGCLTLNIVVNITFNFCVSLIGVRVLGINDTIINMLQSGFSQLKFEILSTFSPVTIIPKLVQHNHGSAQIKNDPIFSPANH